MIISNAVVEAQKLIDTVERFGPYAALSYEDAEGMISALGGKLEVIKDLQHGPSLFIYIAAPMVRSAQNS